MILGRSAALAFALLAALALSASAQPNPRAPEPPAKIEIRARAITAFEPRNPKRTKFGALTFRGGIELTSPNPHFGGISAIRVEADGAKFLAVTDKGYWLRGRIAYEGARPAGIADAEMAPVLGHDGKPLAVRGWYDTEAMARDGGTVWLGIERVNRIVRLNVGRDGLAARAQPVPVSPGIASLPHNKGLECLEFVPPGLPHARSLIAISERGLDEAGNIKGFLQSGAGWSEFSVKRIGDFDVTDCTVTPRGELLLLERSFSRLRGVAMRIRRMALAGIQPGAIIDGPVLIEADMGYQIDNMEGLTVHRAAGALVLTLISDDNFSMIQRTLLLQFTLEEP
ncbi:MAG: esterase-like activity of phytase family protein [Xanthobacteraceae bacterium]